MDGYESTTVTVFFSIADVMNDLCTRETVLVLDHDVDHHAMINKLSTRHRQDKKRLMRGAAGSAVRRRRLMCCQDDDDLLRRYIVRHRRFSRNKCNTCCLSNCVHGQTV